MGLGLRVDNPRITSLYVDPTPKDRLSGSSHCPLNVNDNGKTCENQSLVDERRPSRYSTSGRVRVSHLCGTPALNADGMSVAATKGQRSRRDRRGRERGR